MSYNISLGSHAKHFPKLKNSIFPFLFYKSCVITHFSKIIFEKQKIELFSSHHMFSRIFKRVSTHKKLFRGIFYFSTLKINKKYFQDLINDRITSKGCNILLCSHTKYFLNKLILEIFTRYIISQIRVILITTCSLKLV